MKDEKFIELMYNILKRISKIDKESIQTCILDVPILTIESDKTLEKIFSKLCKDIWNVCKNDATIWITINHSFSNSNMLPLPYQVSDIFQNNGFHVQDIITWINQKKILKNELFCSFYDHILFLTKSKTGYQFDKDSIREKHIWKSIEWGKREFRYNPKGKDPGNVWILLKDDNTGHVVEHIPLDYATKTERILKASTKNGDKILAITGEKETIKYLHNRENVNLIQLENNQDDNILNFNVVKTFSTNSYISQKNFYDIYFKSSEKMMELNNNIINLVVTSPPYWNLKNYKIKNQIGYKESYKNYHERMNKVWSECFRVLKPFGTLWINVNSRTVNGEFIPLHYDIIKNVEKIGFKLFDVLIWNKSSGIPVSKNKFTDRFEFIIGFCKSDGVTINGNINSIMDYKMKKIIKGIPDVWNINRFTGSIGTKFEHPAIFPDDLPRRLIKIFTQPNDIILDPFLGSGTTLLVSMKENRSAIGYEINPDYQKLIEYRLKFFKSPLQKFISPVHYHKI